MYKCVVYSNSSLGREYDVSTKSAAKCAKLYGRCEFGEAVEVRTKKTDRLLSKVMWHPVLGYIRVCV